jgi:hypothetical protein
LGSLAKWAGIFFAVPSWASPWLLVWPMVDGY